MALKYQEVFGGFSVDRILLQHLINDFAEVRGVILWVEFRGGFAGDCCHSVDEVLFTLKVNILLVKMIEVPVVWMLPGCALYYRDAETP